MVLSVSADDISKEIKTLDIKKSHMSMAQKESVFGVISP